MLGTAGSIFHDGKQVLSFFLFLNFSKSLSIQRQVGRWLANSRVPGAAKVVYEYDEDDPLLIEEREGEPS